MLLNDKHKSNTDPYVIVNDIAILTLKTPIYANGYTIQYAKLPAYNETSSSASGASSLVGEGVSYF